MTSIPEKSLGQIFFQQKLELNGSFCAIIIGSRRVSISPALETSFANFGVQFMTDS